MWFCFTAWPRLSCLVDGYHPELVPLALAQTGNPGLQFVDGAGTVVVVSHQGVEPTAELVLFLDNNIQAQSLTQIFCVAFLQSRTSKKGIFSVNTQSKFASFVFMVSWETSVA